MRPGNEYRLTLPDKTATAAGYQVTFRGHLEKPAGPVPAKKNPLAIRIQYARERRRGVETVTAVARVVNKMDLPAPLAIRDLPIPGGFALDADELDEMVGAQRVRPSPTAAEDRRTGRFAGADGRRQSSVPNGSISST